jgi:O-antigen/teichoic acid export membrane protein
MDSFSDVEADDAVDFGPGRLPSQTFRLFAANVTRVGVQLALLPVLARIIAPEAFGLIALAMPVIVFTSILAEAGLVTGLVRSAVSPATESAVFWYAAAVGVGLTLAAALAAAPLGWAIGHRALTPMLWALSPILLLTCLTIAPSARLQRTGRFGAFALCEIGASLFAAAVALAAALHGWGAWSLAAQQLAQASARLGGNLVVARFRPRLVFGFALVRPVLALSAPMLGVNLLAYLSRSLDNLLIGAFIGPKALGFYAAAYQVVQAPEYVLGASVRTVTLPAIALAEGERDAARAIYLSAMRSLSVIAAPALVGCSLLAQPLVRLLLGPAWASAAPLAAILAPLGLAHSYFQLNTAVLLGLGAARTQLRMSLLTSLLGLTGIVAGIAWGPRGVALGYAAGTLLAAVFYILATLRALRAPLSLLAASIGRPYLATAAMALAVAAWQAHAAPAENPALTLLEGAGVGGLAYAAALLALGPGLLARDIRQLARAAGGGLGLSPAIAMPISGASSSRSGRSRDPDRARSGPPSRRE